MIKLTADKIKQIFGYGIGYGICCGAITNDYQVDYFKALFYDALNKKIDKRPEHVAEHYLYNCPNCGEQLQRREYVSGTYDIKEINYCKWCGQALRWCDEE